jgi:hypothetical protein
MIKKIIKTMVDTYKVKHTVDLKGVTPLEVTATSLIELSN